MGEAWEPAQLGDVLEVLHGYAFSSDAMSQLSTGGPIIVSIGNFDYRGGFRFDSTRMREFTAEYPKQFNLTAGDLLVAMTCQTPDGEILGLPGIIPDDGRTYLHNQRIGKVVVNPTRMNKRFAYYCFLSPRVKQQLVSTASGTKILHTAPSRICEVQVRLPSIHEQQCIGALLGALDDKISLNKKIVSSCDQLRSLLLARHLAESVSVKYSQEEPLSSVAEFVNGRAFTKDATGTGRMVVRIAEINSGPSASTVYNDIEVPERHLVHPGDILFAWSGSLSVTRWFRPEAIINQHIFKVLPRPGVPKWLTFELTRAKMDGFKMIAAGKATTMGHIQRHHLDEPVMVPADGDIARLDDELGPLWDRALAAEQESLMLAELRDTLLPKLMSGQLRVRDAEKAVEEAT